LALKLSQTDIDNWYASSSTFSWRGNDVSYRVAGDGTPMLLVHGFPTAGCDWMDIAASLEQYFRLVAPDMLDYGRSLNPLGKTWHIHDQADMIEALLDSLDVGRCHLLIHDVGDTVGQELIARQNDEALSFTIDSVVLMNGGIFPAHHRPRSAQKLLLSPLGPLAARLVGKKRFMSALAEVFGPGTRPAGEALDALWHVSVGVNGKPSLARRIQYMNDRREHEARWVGALRETDLRMVMINGVEDPVSGAHLCDVIERELPSMTVIRLPGIGHFPPLEAPDECVRHILAFHELDGQPVV
jgi:pimeloyl-ACP methyl ester carboxylesterase